MVKGRTDLAKWLGYMERESLGGICLEFGLFGVVVNGAVEDTSGNVTDCGFFALGNGESPAGF